MNCGQRVQLNFFDHLTLMVLFICVSGFYNPLYAFITSQVYFWGRLLFTIGYIRWGPSARLPGALILDVALLTSLVLVVMWCVKVL